LSAAPKSGDSHGPERQRLNKWLWFARVVKTRSLAARLVNDGHVRVNGQRADAPAKLVGPGDVLTIALDREVKVLRVIAGGERRGPYPEARLLYEDLSPPRDSTGSQDALAVRETGAGRPTKKERRDLDRLRDDD
jgi:ribosome-associated heat shock protein Hsp15